MDSKKDMLVFMDRPIEKDKSSYGLIEIIKLMFFFEKSFVFEVDFDNKNSFFV